MAARSWRGFCGRARPPGGRLIRLKRASRHRQAPSRGLALPGASCTLWYLCLRFHILHSRALPRGSPRGHVCSRAWQGRVWASPQGAASPPRLLGAAFRTNFGNSRSWGRMGVTGSASRNWVLLETLNVDALLQSQGSAGPIPNFETRCSVPERNEKYSQMLVSSHVSRSDQPGRADTPGLQGTEL